MHFEQENLQFFRDVRVNSSGCPTEYRFEWLGIFQAHLEYLEEMLQGFIQRISGDERALFQECREVLKNGALHKKKFLEKLMADLDFVEFSGMMVALGSEFTHNLNPPFHSKNGT